MLIGRCAAWKAFCLLFVMECLLAGVGLFSPQLSHAQAPSPSFVYSSYLGGRDYDSAEAVAVDAQGYIYITGETHSRNFPVVNAHQTECRLGSLQSCADAFVTKLKPDGSGIVYSTYFGGTSNDKGYGIAADAQGNAYVTGAMDNAAFVAKFDAEGRLVYQRTFSGYPITIGRAIAVDVAGNAYITGQTLSREFPVQKALQPNPGGVSCYAIGGGSFPLNAFVAKLNPAGALVYSTYLGGDGNDIGLGIAADAAGNAYVVGETGSANFPLVNALRSAYQGGAPQPVGTCDGDDGFVAKLSPDGSALLYSTYFFRHQRIAVDPAGNAHLGNLILKADGSSYDSSVDGAELSVDDLGNAYSLCNFQSLFAADHNTRMSRWVVDSRGNLYVVGATQATNFPVRNPLQPSSGGFHDAFVTQLAGCATPLVGDHSLWVPVVLSAAGANGAFFTSELTLVNRGPIPAVFNFTYVAAFGGGSGTAFDELGAGEQRIIPDAIAYLRSLGVPLPDSSNRGGTLRITFSGLSSPNDAAVLVRTTTVAPGGRAGLAYAAVPNGSLLRGTSYVCGLRQNAQDRSNVAIQNAGTEEDGEVVLRLTLISGDPAAPGTQTLPDEILSPGTFKQFSGILHSQGFSTDQGYVRIERVSGKAPYYAYAVINDQANSDGSFIPPVTEEQSAGRVGLVLPVVVESSLFSSELVLTNWSVIRKVVHLTYFADAIQTSGNAAHRYLELLPGEQFIISNFVQSLRERGIPGITSDGSMYAGMLTARVEDGDLSGIYLAARTSAPGGGGRYGVAYPAVPFDAAASGSVWLYGLRQDAINRTNLALVNTGDVDSNPNVFTIALFDGNGGRKLSTLEGVSLNAKGWTQLPTLMAPGALRATLA